MSVVTIFAQILSEIRKEKGLSQETLAEKAGLDRTYISMLERGKRQPTLETLFKLSEALKISPVSFIEKINRKHENNKGS